MIRMRMIHYTKKVMQDVRIRNMRDERRNSEDLKTAIAPMLSVRNGARALAFYKAAFGTEELFRVDDESGAVVARLSAGGAEFWVADESPEHLNFSPESLGGGSVRMVMIVNDPDAAFERAVTAGATVVWPVANQYGWRLGRIADPFGHHWEIGKPLGGGS
jgi:PhnB protein